MILPNLKLLRRSPASDTTVTKKGKPQINYGLLTNERGIPVSVSVFEGNTGDPKTLLPSKQEG